ncbi:MAG: hypothetical protein AB7S26_03225 [Sandaracinaceae bacterium]
MSATDPNEMPDAAARALASFAGARIATPDRDPHAVLTAVKRRAMGRRIALAGAVAVAALAVLVLRPAGSTAPREPSPAPVADAPAPIGDAVRAHLASRDGAPLRAGEPITSGAIDVGDGGAFEVSLRTGSASLDGPARASVAADGIVVERGSGQASGQLRLEGCGCRATLDGDVAFEAGIRQLSIVVLAGSVEVESPAVYCRIRELDAPNEGESPADEPATEEIPEPAPPAARIDRPAPRCDLGAQAGAYREAMRLRGVDDARLARELREIRGRFRRCPLSHEVDVALIETLLRAGREGEARREARAFVRRYPRSARREEMLRLAQP